MDNSNENEFKEDIEEDKIDNVEEKEELENVETHNVNSEESIAEILNEEIEVNSHLEIQPKKEEYIQEEIRETKATDEKSFGDQVRELNRNLIEASLYAAGSPLTIEEISTKLELPKKEVEELINELAYDYLDRSTALVIAQIGERYQMQIKPEYTEKVSKFAKGGAIAERYLRTLTVIALKQPILKSTVVKIRGTGAYEHVKYLIDNGFIDAIKKGRSHLLTTTDKYADMFGLPKDIRLLKKAMIDQLGVQGEKSEETQK